MSLFSSKIPKREIVIILDIGSGTVGGAIVGITEDKNPSLLYSSREPFRMYGKIGGQKKLGKSMFDAINKMSENLIKEGAYITSHREWNCKISKAYCFFSSPWIASRHKTIKIERAKPFEITEDLMATPIKVEQDKIRQDLINGKDPHFGNQNVSLVEGLITHVKLNGYDVDNPYGKKVNSAEFSMLWSFMPTYIYEGVIETMNKNFRSNNITIHSSVSGIFSAVRSMFPGDESFLCIDIGGEITDIMMVRRNVLFEIASFPIGRKNLLRKVMRYAELSEPTASTFARMYSEGTLTGPLYPKIEKACKEFDEQWKDLMQKTLTKLSEEASVPVSAYAISNFDTSKYFSKLLTTISSKPFSLSNEALTCNPIEQKFIANYCYLKNENNRDQTLAILAVFVNSLIKHSEPLIH